MIGRPLRAMLGAVLGAVVVGIPGAVAGQSLALQAAGGVGAAAGWRGNRFHFRASGLWDRQSEVQVGAEVWFFPMGHETQSALVVVADPPFRHFIQTEWSAWAATLTARRSFRSNGGTVLQLIAGTGVYTHTENIVQWDEPAQPRYPEYRDRTPFSTIGVNSGVGLQIPVSRIVALTVDGRGHLTFGGSSGVVVMVTVGVGMEFRFGA